MSSIVSAKKRKDELNAAIHEKQLEGVQAMDAAEANLKLEKQKALAGSWKDEYVTLVVTIPAILAFAGEWGAKVVTDGFTALGTTPEWYQYLLIAVITAAAGIPLTAKAVGKIKTVSQQK
ncbi:MAG TPA: hypothetical protein VKP88_00995 [Candidatus Paceibacterota bacterium]|nr:hypothetical protein [Candidatus Paceibacterota bacterium]